MTSRPVLLPAQLRGASFGTSVKKVKPATKTGANRELPQPSSAKREQVRPYFEPVPAEPPVDRSYFKIVKDGVSSTPICYLEEFVHLEEKEIPFQPVW
jgi:hypothetical protein